MPRLDCTTVTQHKPSIKKGLDWQTGTGHDLCRETTQRKNGYRNAACNTHVGFLVVMAECARAWQIDFPPARLPSDRGE